MGFRDRNGIHFDLHAIERRCYVYIKQQLSVVSIDGLALNMRQAIIQDCDDSFTDACEQHEVSMC